MNVKLIRMSSGEDVIAEVVNHDDNSLTLKNGIVGVPTQQGTLSFVAWSPMISKEVKDITVSTNFVVYVADAAEEIVSQYEQMYSPISTPEKKKLIL
tara:strand:- start:189 stop:479 length:291 start_codon:yes stop_codon:yes gene_type:complete